MVFCKKINIAHEVNNRQKSLDLPAASVPLLEQLRALYGNVWHGCYDCLLFVNLRLLESQIAHLVKVERLSASAVSRDIRFVVAIYMCLAN